MVPSVQLVGGGACVQHEDYRMQVAATTPTHIIKSANGLPGTLQLKERGIDPGRGLSKNRERLTSTEM